MNHQMMYPEVINKDELLKSIKEKVMPLVNLKEEDCDIWDNGFRTGEVVHKYFVYDNEEYERIEITKEEFYILKALTEGKYEYFK